MALIFAVEVECFQPIKKFFLLPDWIFKGSDGSIISNKHGIDGAEEFRNKEPKLYCEKSIQEWIDFLRLIKANGFQVNKTCGLHFHMSDPQRPTFIPNVVKSFGTINALANNYHVKPNRRKYCLSFSHHHYAPINWLSRNHVEFRHFNGSLNIRHFVQSLEWCKNKYEELILLHQSPNAHN